jgi:hypothetical protein
MQMKIMEKKGNTHDQELCHLGVVIVSRLNEACILAKKKL